MSQDKPGVVILPPLLYAAALAAGLLLHLLMPRQPLTPWVARPLGMMLLIASGALARWGEKTMRRAGTNVSPNEPTLTIVGDGPFRFTRNPLYVSMTGLYLGVTLLVDALWPLLLLVPLVLVAHYGIIRREERYLEAKFGETYRAYNARVRRWL
jgi:protein-S-isoprenylcysteine O-methyltransferase Ste14